MDYSGGAFLAIILTALVVAIGCYSYGYGRGANHLKKFPWSD